MNDLKTFEKLLEESYLIEQQNLDKVLFKLQNDARRGIDALETTEWSLLLRQYHENPQKMSASIRSACEHKLGYLDTISL